MPRPLPQAFRVYRVGGSVRDEMLGLPAGDRDYVVVGATPETLLASGFKPVGRDFPVFLHPDTREEYALARTERKHGRGYRGFEFFASPEVTLEQDLARRDLTINAMARADDGTLVDPHGGVRDLEARVLRHVSDAFVEDPLRVLRVARFAARFGFDVAPETRSLMQAIVAGGELETLAPERIWQEFAKGLMSPDPARMLAVLRDCGALSRLLPELDARFAGGGRRAQAAGATLAAVGRAAATGAPLPVRYAALAVPGGGDGGVAALRVRIREADAIAGRLKPPQDCRDLARLAARHLDQVTGAPMLAPAALLDLLQAVDALRRPERLAALLAAWECIAGASAVGASPQRERLVAALRVVRGVDAGAAARGALQAGARGEGRGGRSSGGATPSHGSRSGGSQDGDAAALAVRAARLAALRAWRRSAAG